MDISCIYMTACGEGDGDVIASVGIGLHTNNSPQFGRVSFGERRKREGESLLLVKLSICFLRININFPSCK